MTRALPPEVEAFARTLPFRMDDFQVHACACIANGHGVLVAAPTGAGKTVVADFAVYCAVAAPRDKLFYTTPIKALSNQKYQDLCQRYGSNNVGLLTGDVNVNPTARIVVMTTEVLRNMLYAESALLEHLAYVVMDEVHFLADRFRGPVWEEVIIQLPNDVAIVSLSATVSNAEEFGAWLQAVRGKTDVIVSEFRPVPLTQHVMVGNDLVDLFVPKARKRVTDEAQGDDEPNDDLRLNPYLERLWAGPSISDRNSRGPRRQRGHGRSRQQQTRRASRAEIVEALRHEQMLPAIVFIFSRAGCDAAVRECVRANLSLTSDAERRQIAAIVDAACADLPTEDLEVLGFAQWRRALEAGLAAHHAGLLPAFKSVVEDLFQRKLLKTVFATETLALGINMPARTVVLERLDKFNGVSREQITPGEYTQLTGRAGRRGIDTVGHAVIQWRGDAEASQLASLATKRTYPLYSRFRPTYNMAVNLIDRYGFVETRSILESSFAQFQADRSVVSLTRRLREQQTALDGYAASFECHLGDFMEYSEIRRKISDAERATSSAHHNGKHGERQRVQQELDGLRHLLKRHPCHDCPDREKHARWAERWWRLKRQQDALATQIQGRTGNVARIYERVVQILKQLGYLRGSEESLRVTQDGRTLQRIYGDRDLLVAECLRQGVWDSLDAATFAAIISTIMVEPRRNDEHDDPRVPRGRFSAASDATERLWAELDALERDGGMPGTERPNPTMALGIFHWANGANLERVLDEANMAAGDFVRWCKQCIDMLDQISQIAQPALSGVALDAIARIRRGIVDYGAPSE